MTEFFDKSFFQNNRQKLLQQAEAKLLVITANTTLQRSGDTSFPFRQDSNFWYLSGINEPDYILVLSERETFLISPKLSDYQKIMETQTGHHILQKTSGINDILSSKEGWEKLRQLLKVYSKIGLLMPANTKRYYAISPNPARTHLLQRLKRHTPATTKLIDIKKSLTNLRMIKQASELMAIRAAIDITSQTIQDIFTKDWYKNFGHEYEVEAALNAGFRKRGASGHAFTPIVISGPKTATIHNFNTDDPLKHGELIQVDVGAEVSNYGADISRVFPIGSKLSLRQREIYEAVKDVQNFALSLIKPGAYIRENEKLIEAYMGKKLKHLGAISNESKSAIRSRYPHSCSHLLGLDTHDAADYSLPLVENMVLTVEPGIYITEENMGIRIEDDVLVTKNGAQILSKNLSRDMD